MHVCRGQHPVKQTPLGPEGRQTAWSFVTAAVPPAQRSTLAKQPLYAQSCAIASAFLGSPRCGESRPAQRQCSPAVALRTTVGEWSLSGSESARSLTRLGSRAPVNRKGQRPFAWRKLAMRRQCRLSFERISGRRAGAVLQGPQGDRDREFEVWPRVAGAAAQRACGGRDRGNATSRERLFSATRCRRSVARSSQS